MKIEQRKWTTEHGWQVLRAQEFSQAPQLVLVFGSKHLLEKAETYEQVKGFYQGSHILLCSTGGEICADSVSDNSLSVVAIEFASTTVRFATATINASEESATVGRVLADMLPKEDLRHVMVFADGLIANGTTLVAGMTQVLPRGVSLTGGFVGDNGEFHETLVGLDMAPTSKTLIAVGFYGDSLIIGYGSVGGWDPFGPLRTVTKSHGNVVYEIDGKPALALYKEYLGEQAKGLPGSGLFFPLSLRLQNQEGREDEVVRSLAGVNETEQSITFFGDIPEGIHVQLMKANFERVIQGAADAATKSLEPMGDDRPDLALLISCIGRKMVLRERTEEEIEAVRDMFGEQTVVAGFYSFGEICPITSSEKRSLFHNQTMTITTFKEN